MRSRYFYGYNIVAAGFIIQAVSVGAMFTYRTAFYLLILLALTGFVLITLLKPPREGDDRR